MNIMSGPMTLRRLRLGKFMYRVIGSPRKLPYYNINYEAFCLIYMHIN
jgi:hypothetical protein